MKKNQDLLYLSLFCKTNKANKFSKYDSLDVNFKSAYKK